MLLALCKDEQARALFSSKAQGKDEVIITLHTRLPQECFVSVLKILGKASEMAQWIEELCHQA